MVCLQVKLCERLRGEVLTTRRYTNLRLPLRMHVKYSSIKHKETRRMAIANGTCISFCNSLRHNLATSGESRRYVVAFTRFAAGGIWLPQESLMHILASPGPGYAPGTIAVNVTWMERGFNACQTYRSMYSTHLSSTVFQ